MDRLSGRDARKPAAGPLWACACVLSAVALIASLEASAEEPGPRLWRVRVVPPQFALLYSIDDFIMFGMEYGVQVELAERHSVSLIGHFAIVEAGALIGGGVGYGYEIHVVRNIFFVELGAAAGYWFYNKPAAQVALYRTTCIEYDDSTGECVHWSAVDNYKEAFIALVVRPTLHVGYKWVFFSLGPRLAVGSATLAGGVAGIMLRF